ncbi:S-layer-like y domain-containing protein [Filibacter tadaridae]|uniref:S-layer protein n=1 Tax=Filibacter tadaridae TaxID=2483811 RepID=A0A3P5X6K5_9BACL|nr:S-layer homology domain-containing protein [Filibacter tadaridae]VDC23919.1 S-layer protein precursor [Filibacter tadaridae]
MAHQPKAYKKFVATAATATLVATALVPAASAAETKSFTDVSKNYKEAVDYLLANGITEGTSATTFGTTGDITRGDAAVFIARALKLDTANAKDQGFTDLNNRVAKAVNAVAEAKIASGTSATTFNPDAKITRQEMAKILVNAYELDGKGTSNSFTDVNSNWDEYVDALVKTGVTLGLTDNLFGATDNVTRGQFALFIFRAEHLTPATPEVVSVSAINGKQLEIKFNKAVDKDTVITKTTAGGDIAGSLVDGVFTFTALKKADGTTASNTVSADVATGSLSADGKTLTVSTGAGVFEGNYTVSVNKGVESADGQDVPAFSTLIYVKDEVAPVLLSGNASAKTNTNQLTLVFSEPVDHTGAVAYIDGTPATLSAGSNANELTVTSSTAIDAGKTVGVQVLNVKDAAGNVIAPNPSNTNVTVLANTTAPAVSSVTVTGEKTFTATFTKPVNSATFLNNVAVVSGGISPSSTAFTVSNVSADGKTVTFSTSANIFANAATFTGTLIISKEVQDNAGNKLGADYSQSITFNKDVTAPAVSSVTTDSTNKKVLVTFSKNVNLVGSAAATIAKVTLINSNGKVVALDASATASIVNNNQLQIDNNGVALAAGTYTVRLAAGAVQDGLTENNQNAATTQTLVVKAPAAAADTAKPVVTTNTTVTGYNGASTAPAAEQVLTYTVVDSGSGIDINSVLSLANYTIDGKVLPTGTYITTSGYSASAPTGTVTVSLHLPSASISKATTSSQLVISNLKDLAGNVITPAVTAALAIGEGVAPTLASVNIATGDNTTLVTAFSEDVTGVTLAAFTVTLNGKDVSSEASFTAITVGPDKGKYYIQVAQSYDAVLGTVFIDVNGDADYDAGTDVSLATGVATPPTATEVNFTSAAVSNLKVDLDTVTSITDTQGNLATVATKVVK